MQTIKDTETRNPQALVMAVSSQWQDAERQIPSALKFTDEPAIPWFLLGRRPVISDTFQNLMARFRENFGDCL